MAKRTTITISEPIYQRALAVMEARAFDDFSGYIQALIREEYERRHGAPPVASAMHDAPPTAEQLAAQAIAHGRDTADAAPVSYGPPAKRRAKKPQSP